MSFRHIAALSIIVSVCLFCGEKKNPVSPPAGPTELEGVWTGYSDVDNPPYPLLTYSFANNTVIVTRDTCGNQGLSPCAVELYRGTFVVDTSVSPKTIDIHLTQSSVAAWANKTLLAVYYKFANNVNLSANEPGTPRPVSQTPPIVDPPVIHLGQ
jgi:hypothetical protein